MCVRVSSAVVCLQVSGFMPPHLRPVLSVSNMSLSTWKLDPDKYCCALQGLLPYKEVLYSLCVCQQMTFWFLQAFTQLQAEVYNGFIFRMRTSYYIFVNPFTSCITDRYQSQLYIVLYIIFLVNYSISITEKPTNMKFGRYTNFVY